MPSLRLSAAALCIGALGHGCTCGVVPPSGMDSGHNVYDSGTLDSGVLDVVAQDLAPGDTTSPPDSAVAADSAGVDAGAGTDAGAGFDAAAFDAVGNQAPSVESLADVWMWPGDTHPLVAVVSDPNLPSDQLHYAWAFEPAAPAGVLVSGADSASASVVVDRAVYEAGPMDQQYTLRLTVTDLGGLSASRTATVRVVDERGPYVSNLSPYEGTGYAEAGARHGYCGAPSHPCNNFADVMINYADSGWINSSRTYPFSLLVATTGTDYPLDQTLQFSDGYGLECGFDPATWTRAADYTPTPLRFSGAVGFFINSNAVVRGCDLQGVEPSEAMDLRVAIRVHDATAYLHDNILVGSQRGLTHLPQQAIGLQLLHFYEGDAPLVEGNDVEGGQAVASAVGLSVQLGTPVIRGNSIVGGQAGSAVGIALAPSVSTSGVSTPSRVEDNVVLGGQGGNSGSQGALGILLAAGDAVIVDNPSVEGGTSPAFNAGLWVNNPEATPEISGNTFVGVRAAAGATLAAGAIFSTGVMSSANSFSGGHATYAVGLLVDPDLDDPAVGDAVVFTSTDDSFSGGQGSTVVGVSLDDGASGTLQHATVRGTAQGGSPLHATGVAVAEGSAVVIAGQSDVHSGNAASLARGLALQAGARGAHVVDSTLVAGNVVIDGGASAGVAVEDGRLELEGCTVAAGNAATAAVGISLDCRAADTAGIVHRVSSTTVSTGSADVTMGIAVRSCGNIELQNDSVEVGDASDGVSVGLYAVATDTYPVGGSYQSGDAPAGSAYGVVFLASGTAAHLVTNDIAASGGDARDESAGIGLGDDVSRVGIIDSTAQGGTAASSSGLHVRGAASACDIASSRLRGGLATLVSAGLFLEQGCDGCAIGGNLVEGGTIQPGTAAGRSVGARLFAPAPLATPTLVFSNRFVGGQAAQSHGVELDGRAGASLRVLNNNIAAGGAAGNGTSSVGVLLGRVLLGPGTDQVGVLVGNIISAGEASTRYNIYENADCSAARDVAAEPFAGSLAPLLPPGGRNNNLVPSSGGGTHVLLADARRGVGLCQIDDITAIGRRSDGTPAVNNIEPYAEALADELNRSWSVDPAWTDGYHLGAASVLIDKAYTSQDYWQVAGLMQDVDGDDRPLGVRYDIGCDEVAP